MDPPEHTARRRTVAPAFTPAEMTRLTELGTSINSVI
jgi:cytochrome P450